MDATTTGTPTVTRRPTVAIAFGGGGARGLAHIHVIEVLDELGIRPVALAGSSIGAIMAAAMAAGMPGRDIRGHVFETICNRTEMWSRIWRARPASMRDMVADGVRIGQFNIERILEAFLPHTIPRDFADLPIRTMIVASDYYGQSEVVCETGDLRNALACSAAVPAIFRPVRRAGRVMIDGGLLNPVPFDHLAGLADIVIGIDVVGGPTGDPDRLPARIDSMIGATQLMMQSINATKLRAAPPDIFLRPDVSGIKVLDFLKAEDILERSKGVRAELRAALGAALARRDAGRGSGFPQTA